MANCDQTSKGSESHYIQTQKYGQHGRLHPLGLRCRDRCALDSGEITPTPHPPGKRNPVLPRSAALSLREDRHHGPHCIDGKSRIIRTTSSRGHMICVRCSAQSRLTFPQASYSRHCAENQNIPASAFWVCVLERRPFCPTCANRSLPGAPMFEDLLLCLSMPVLRRYKSKATMDLSQPFGFIPIFNPQPSIK